MTSQMYTSVVFAAWAVPTVPHETGSVGDPNGAGYVSGEYIGLDDPKEDLKQRVELVGAAADQAYEMAVDTRNDPSVLHCFLIPEFFFRGKDGAYDSIPPLHVATGAGLTPIAIVPLGITNVTTCAVVSLPIVSSCGVGFGFSVCLAAIRSPGHRRAFCQFLGAQSRRKP